MKKLTAGILATTVAVGAAAVYLPIKVGDTVQQQITRAVAQVNAREHQYGVNIEILDYRKNAFDSQLTTRLRLADTTLAPDAENTYIDLTHEISHGITQAEFRTEIVVTEAMKAHLTEMDHKVPLHFGGTVSTSKAELNTYIEGFTLNADQNEVRVNPGIIRLNYEMEPARYTLNGIWNGGHLKEDQINITLDEISLKGTGQQFSEYLWSYNNSLTISSLKAVGPQATADAASITFSDRFDIQKQTDQPDTLHYSGDWSLDKLHISQFGQTLYDFQPSGFSYALTGPTVNSAETLMQMAQEMNPEQMTQEDAGRILPVLSEVLQAARFSLHDVNVVTSEGRINGDLSLKLDTNQQQLIQALNFPPILMNYLNLKSDATISKSLFNSMPVLAMMAMQLNERQAYQEDEDDMLIHAELSNGQLTINDVLMR